MDDERSCDDPSDALLSDLLQELDQPGQFLVVEKTGLQPPGQHYSQAVLNDGNWILEYRDGGPDRHFQARLSGPFQEVHEIVARVITGWARDRPGWRDELIWVEWP
jgi:hypothetical protein